MPTRPYGRTASMRTARCRRSGWRAGTTTTSRSWRYGRTVRPGAGTLPPKMPISAAPSATARTMAGLIASSSSTRIRGCSVRKRLRSPGRYWTIAELFATTRRLPRTPWAQSPTSLSIWARSRMSTRAWCRNARPAGVGESPVRSRRKSCTFTAFSRSAMRLLTAEAAMCSRSAALARLCSSTTATTSLSVSRSMCTVVASVS